MSVKGEFGGIDCRNGQFFAPDGGLIATLKEDGAVEYERCMAGYYKKFVEAWLARPADDTKAPPPDPAPETPSVPPVAVTEDIPDELLPEFDRRLGVATPGFQEWCKLRELTDEQIAKVIRRLERSR